MFSDAAVGHTLVNIVIADPTCRDLVECAAKHNLVATIDAERRKVTHYWDRVPRTKFAPFALETYGALFHRSDRFLDGVSDNVGLCAYPAVFSAYTMIVLIRYMC